MIRAMRNVASVTSSVCDLFGIPRPADCVAPPFSEVAAFAAGRTVTKALVFAADAIGAHLVRSYPEAFEPVARHAPTSIEACAVMPSVTPVCFASMFTGALPEIHGIRKSERPTLTCDSLFDALSRAGRRVAIVAVENSSIDLIFRNRRIDYFSEAYDGEVVERTLNLITADQHDFILAYQQEYDDQMHATVPRSPEALRAMTNHVRNFDRVARAARSRWATTSHAVVFVSDHGTHIDPLTGRGTHGSDMADDLEVRLFWGVHFPV
jgi:acyl-CoA thioesterase FadM